MMCHWAVQRNTKRCKITTTSTTLHNNLKYLLVLHPHCLGLKKDSGPLCGSSETNCGLSRHCCPSKLGGGGRIHGPGPAAPGGEPLVKNRVSQTVDHGDHNNAPLPMEIGVGTMLVCIGDINIQSNKDTNIQS